MYTNSTLDMSPLGMLSAQEPLTFVTFVDVPTVSRLVSSGGGGWGVANFMSESLGHE